MTKITMSSLRSAILALSIGIAIALGLAFHLHNLPRKDNPADILAKLLVVEKDLATARQDLLGHTTFTDYAAVSKKAIEGKSKFLAAKVDREYVHVEHIQRSVLGITSDATIIIKYAVEYSFGFDLRPSHFAVSGDKNGITITLTKPDLVASPSVNILSHEIPSKSVLIDEQAAVIALQQQLYALARQRAIALKSDEAVIALCEKKLEEFLRSYIAQLPNVISVPAIRFVHR